MKADATLIGTKSRIELHPIALVDLNLVAVIFPDYSKLDDSLWDGSDS